MNHIKYEQTNRLRIWGSLLIHIFIFVYCVTYKIYTIFPTLLIICTILELVDSNKNNDRNKNNEHKVNHYTNKPAQPSCSMSTFFHSHQFIALIVLIELNTLFAIVCSSVNSNVDVPSMFHSIKIITIIIIVIRILTHLIEFSNTY